MKRGAQDSRAGDEAAERGVFTVSILFSIKAEGLNKSLQASATAPSVLTGPRSLDIIIAAKLSFRGRC